MDLFHFQSVSSFDAFQEFHDCLYCAQKQNVSINTKKSAAVRNTQICDVVVDSPETFNWFFLQCHSDGSQNMILLRILA